MSNAVAAVLRGYDYQGRFFWTKAARLRMPTTHIERVGYEYDDLKSFDDVVVWYRKPVQDEFYQPVDVDYFQLKFRVAGGKAFTWEALMDPQFIGAVSHSLLIKLKNAVERQGARPGAARFTIVAPAPVMGVLARVVGNDAGAILFDKLYRGVKNTDEAKVRREWRQHLGLRSDDELRPILAPLRIRSDFPTLEGLREELDYRLDRAGLAPWDGTERATRYDDLPKKLSQAGVKSLNQAELEALLGRDGLITGTPYDPHRTIPRLGVRSYIRWAERMEDETDDMLCLVRHFDGRWIRDQSFWNAEVIPAVNGFIERAARGHCEAELVLDAHTSIAIAAGWCLDSKARVDVAPVQGTTVWKPNYRAARRARLWEDPVIADVGGGPDVALVLSVTHPAWEEAAEYVGAHIGTVGRIVGLTVQPNPARHVVEDGTHAYQLAESAIEFALGARPARGSAGVVHLFLAGPNGLAFFIGQLAHRLGRVALYEHDFRQQRSVPYEPSVVLGT